MNYNIVKKVSYVLCFFTFFVCALIYFFINSKITSQECMSVSDKDAKEMISTIFENKLEKSDDGLILFALNPKHLIVERIERHKAEAETSGYIEIFFKDKNTTDTVLRASIYDNCEVQWIKG